ncbi:hypothetical protein [Sphingomonas sp. LR55]|jgi:hypothetical protein|uniref:hypothetical protein n=1 Tax=Sphingomonas sp. LR55 TaxID=3050231 RepID=UPI002FE2DA3D
MMQGLIEIAERPWVSLVIGTAIGLFSIILSVILYRRSLIRNSLSFVKVEVEILTVNNPTWQSDLDIKYQGIEITRLTAGRVGIWNSGNTTINYDQVVGSQPLMVKVPDDSRLLVCHATVVSRTVLNVKVEQCENNQAKILFDFLDPGDGFVLHIAQSSPRNTLAVTGTIKGLPHGLTEFPISGRLWVAIARSSVLPILIMGFGTGLSGLLARALSTAYSLKPDDWQYKAIATTMFVVMILLAIGSAFLERLIQKGRSASIPKSIRTDPVISSSMGIGSK